MITQLGQLTVFLPWLIIILTVVSVILSIAFNGNHFFVFCVSVLGFLIAFFSLYFLFSITSLNIVNLFHINSYSIVYIGMILIASISTCVFSYPWLLKYPFNKKEFYLLIVLSTLGAISLVVSDHLLSLFLNIEILSLPIFGLIAYSSNEKYSLEASFKYIVLSGISSSFFLFGIAWVYSIVNNLSFISIHDVCKIFFINDKLILVFGILMILFSFFFKLSIVPFHLWTPDIYQGTPLSVLSFFSTVSKISIFVALLNFLSNISIVNYPIIYFILSLVAIISMFFGNLMAIFQEDLKRFLGYSSISQFGYLFIVLLRLNNYVLAWKISVIYLFSYLLCNIALFGIMNLISHFSQNNDLNRISLYKGFFWKQPILAILFTIVLFSFAGVPMTLGFIGKLYILLIIIQDHLWIVGFTFLFSTMLGMYSYLRIITNFYLNTSQSSFIKGLNLSQYWFITPTGIIIIISVLMLLFFGCYPNPLISTISFN